MGTGPAVLPQLECEMQSDGANPTGFVVIYNRKKVGFLILGVDFLRNKQGGIASQSHLVLLVKHF